MLVCPQTAEPPELLVKLKVLVHVLLRKQNNWQSLKNLWGGKRKQQWIFAMTHLTTSFPLGWSYKEENYHQGLSFNSPLGDKTIPSLAFLIHIANLIYHHIKVCAAQMHDTEHTVRSGTCLGSLAPEYGSQRISLI